MPSVSFRRAEERDVFPLLRLYQLACPGNLQDPVLLDARKLEATLRSDNSVWVVADRDGELGALISILIDRGDRLGQMNRVLVDPQWGGSETVLQDAMPLLESYLKSKGVEVLFSNTRALTEAQQQMAIAMGFRILGIFPSTLGPSTLGGNGGRINGLLAYFFEGVLETMHRSDVTLHPLIAPHYEIARQQCGLPSLPVSGELGVLPADYQGVPDLEILFAPKFAYHRFDRLRGRQSLSTHFYPFQEPNALITDPAGRIEIFVRMIPEMRAAAIIGERLDYPVNPADLYQQVCLMLNRQNISYIEVINDAADPVGTQYLMDAGFLPCAYFPCFKRAAESRRDYAILARSSERLFGASSAGMKVNRVYLRYLREYYQLEGKFYLDKLRPN